MPREIFGINLTKYVQDMREESYKTCVNEITRKLNKRRDITCTWVGRLTIHTMPILPNFIYTLIQSQLKPKRVMFWILTDYKVYLESQKIQNSQYNIRCEEQIWETDTS